MTTQTHTQGPWIKEGGTVCQADTLQTICKTSGKDEATQSANARLIAAAPDLISALERAESALSFFINDEGECDVEALDEARAAIAKATGKQ